LRDVYAEEYSHRVVRRLNKWFYVFLFFLIQ
jgi:hypothetical protein